MNLLSAYFKYMREPAITVRAVLHARRLGQGLLGYACAALCMVLFFNVGASVSPAVLFAKFVLVFAAELVIGYFVASLSGLFLDLSGSRASSAELFTLVGLSGFIKGLLVAYALIAAAQPALSFLGPLVWLLVWGLQIGFLIKNLGRAYGVSGGKAFVSLLFAVLPVAAAFFLLFVFFIWFIVASV